MITTKENFKKYVDLCKKHSKYIDDVYTTLGIDMIYAKSSEVINEFETLCEELFFTKNGADLVQWWLWEDVEKKLYDAESEEELYDLTNFDDFWEYLIKNKDVYLK